MWQWVRSRRGSWVLCVSVFLALVLLVWRREPDIVSAPRFWAEEGSVYASYARTHTAVESLLTPHLDYYAAAINIATVLAMRVAPLERAPLVTVLIAWMLQLVPVAIVMFTSSPVWKGLAARATLALLIVLSCTGEIWLTTLGAPFHLSLAAALILFVDTAHASRGERNVLRGVLVLASITGPTTVFLLPAFVVASLSEGARERRTQTLFVLGGAVVQALAFAWSLDAHGVPHDRFQRLGLMYLRRIYIDGAIARPFLFQSFYEQFPRLNLVAACAVGVVLIWGLTSTKTRGAVVAMVSLSALSLITSLHMTGGERYFMASGVLLYGICLACVPPIVRPLTRGPIGLIALLLIACALVRSTITFESRMTPFFQADWPVWRNEVQTWRTTPGYQPRVHPPPAWTVDLGTPR